MLTGTRTAAARTVADGWLRVQVHATQTVPITVTPDPTAFGAPAFAKFLNQAAFWAVVAAAAGFLFGLIAWALGSTSQNYHHTKVGKVATMVSVLAAAGAAATSGIINWAYGLGFLAR